MKFATRDPMSGVGKWRCVLNCEHQPWREDAGWRSFTFGIYRLDNIPPIGAEICRSDYTGFLIRMRFWLPFEFR